MEIRDLDWSGAAQRGREAREVFRRLARHASILEHHVGRAAGHSDFPRTVARSVPAVVSPMGPRETRKCRSNVASLEPLKTDPLAAQATVPPLAGGRQRTPRRQRQSTPSTTNASPRLLTARPRLRESLLV